MLVFQVFGILSLIHGVSVPWGPFQQHPWPLRHLTGALGCKCSYWHHRENSCWLERTSSRVGAILLWQTKRWRSKFTQGNKLDNQYITYAQPLCFKGFNSSLFTNSGSQSPIKPAKKAHHFFPCYISQSSRCLCHPLPFHGRAEVPRIHDLSLQQISHVSDLPVLFLPAETNWSLILRLMLSWV